MWAYSTNVRHVKNYFEKSKSCRSNGDCYKMQKFHKAKLKIQGTISLIAVNPIM